MGRKATPGAKSWRSLGEDEIGGETPAGNLSTEDFSFPSAADELQGGFPPLSFVPMVESAGLEWLCSV